MRHRRWANARTMAIGIVLAVLAVAALPGAVAAAPGRPAPAPAAPDPGDQPWEPVPRDRVAEECGLDPDLLEEADAAFPTSSYTVVRYGKLCWTGGGGPSPTQTYAVQSVTKTFGAILVGMVASRSSLSDTDLVLDWLTPAQAAGLNPEATVAHVLAQTATKPSLAVDEKGPFVYDTLGSREINRLRDIMNVVIAAEPENFPGVTNVYEFAQQELFDVLGMADSRWPGPGFLDTGLGFGLHSTVEDMSRLGLLILRKGAWDGVQLIDEEYVYRMSHPSFEDANTGHGYLLWLNAENMQGPSGRAHGTCAPYAVWPEHPHEPFFETTHNYGGSPFDDQPYDIGVVWAAGAGGQWTTVHRGLDLVISGRNVTGGGQWRLWDAVRPALVALDDEYAGDEDGFCDVYLRSAYAPTMLSPWAPRSLEQCKDSGWRNGPWRNQGECVSHFARMQ